MTPSPGTISRLLVDWRDGDKTALDRLIPLVYRELRRLAGYYMRRQGADHTLQTSALINEAYLRLIDHKNMRWENRAHFYAVAAQAIEPRRPPLAAAAELPDVETALPKHHFR